MALVALARLLADLLGPDAPLAVSAYDGSHAGPPDAVATVRVVRPEAVARFLTAPNDLGLGRAYVAGDIELEGDLYAGYRIVALNPPRLDPVRLAQLLKAVGRGALRRPPALAEEAQLHGGVHSRARDAAAIRHHYDVSNDFYRLVLGPSMTYSCAVWADPAVGLEAAQAAKYELICSKLGLEPGMRLLDIGCGWGGMVMHAAQYHGVRAVGVTLSPNQVEAARARVYQAGLEDRVEIRLQDERDVDDGPYDAISSIGMFEHVGRSRLAEYAQHVRALLAPGGRFMNHGIGRPPAARTHRVTAEVRRWLPQRTFVNRFVFPDGELHEIGTVVAVLEEAGLEVRHLETLREHYNLTLRAWVTNLEQHWDEAVALVGERRARVWRLYMVGAAVAFDLGNTTIHQVLTVAPEHGRSGLPLRPSFSSEVPLTAP
jgi:cyclopropane-fatty-acyl-phospholipid synthase